VVRSTTSASLRYQARIPPFDSTQIPTFLNDELRRIADSLDRALDGNYELQAAEPDKPRAGMVRYADGSNWNPGNGAGLYFYTDQWRHLMSVGTGGTVTQATSKSTAVTLNTDSGEITMNNAALGAATIVSFTLTNSTIGAADVLALNHASGGTIGSYSLTASCAAGSATIYVRNNTAGILSEAVVIRFVRIPGAVS
jgi:hypothetical protein